MVDYYVRIRNLREDNDESQESLAALLEVSQRTVSSLERGLTPLKYNDFIKLAEHFNVSLAYLAGFTDRKGKFPE